MGLPHLHLFSGNRPDARLEVELGPFSVPQFPGPDEEHARELQGAFHNERSDIAVDRAEQGGNVLRVRERRKMGLRCRRQRTLEVRGTVALRPACRHGVAEDLSADALYAVGSFQCSPRLHAPQDGQQLRRFDLGNRPLPDPGEGVPLKPLDRSFCMDRRPAGRELLVPLPRDDLEAVLHLAPRRLLCLADLAGVYAVRDLLPRIVAPHPCVSEGYFGVGAEGDELLLVVEAVLESPPLPAIRSDLQIEALAVVQLIGLGFRFRALDLDIG